MEITRVFANIFAKLYFRNDIFVSVKMSHLPLSNIWLNGNFMSNLSQLYLFLFGENHYNFLFLNKAL
jgi:hypothetical protein